MKVTSANNVLVGITKRGLELGRFHCSHFNEKFATVGKRNFDEYDGLLECLVRFEYITNEERESELDYVIRREQVREIKQIKSNICQAFQNSEFVKYVEKIKGKIPEFLTGKDEDNRNFALALMKLKGIIDE